MDVKESENHRNYRGFNVKIPCLLIRESRVRIPDESPQRKTLENAVFSGVFAVLALVFRGLFFVNLLL